MVKLQKINFKNINHFFLNNFLYLFLSFFIFSFLVVFKNNEINNDGLLYLSQAYELSSQGYSLVFDLYPKSIYAVLIAFISNIFSISLYTSAKLINLFFLGIALYFYLLHIKLLYTSNKSIFIGLLLVFCCSPIFDSYASMIIRDHGFWALSMIGSYFFLKYCQTYSFKYTFLYQLMFFVSILFRQEGVLFLILLPLLPIYKNLKFSVITKNYLLILLFLFSLVFSMLFNFGDFFSQFINFYKFFLDKLNTFYSNFINNFPIYSSNEHLEFLLEKYNFLFTLYLLFILFYSFFKSFGYIGFLLFFYIYKTKIYMNIKSNKILLFLISIGIISVLLHFFYVYVISGRYFALIWWWLYILLVPYIYELFLNFKSSYFKYFFIFIVIIGFFDNFIDSSEKYNQEKSMANFISSNYLINDIEFIDTDRIKFYSYGNDDKYFLSNNIGKKKYLLIKKDIFLKYFKDHEIQQVSSNNNPMYYLVKK